MPIPTKVLIIPGLTLATVSDTDLARMQHAAGEQAEFIVSDYKSAPEHIADADIVLGIVPSKLFAFARSLKWVQSISSGVDAFMYPEFINSPTILTCEKGLVGEHLADHGMGLLLMLTRQLAAARDLGPDAWQHRPQLRAQEIELTGSTMGIIGFGGTGQAMARRAQAFGMRCLAVDRDPIPPAHGVIEVLSPNSLYDMLGAADVVVVCCPLTPDTRALLNADAFAATKPGAFLINVTRGEVMDEAALVDALRSGQLRGAGLDVAPREPLPADSALWQLDNVVMTPHTAGASQYRIQRNIDRFVTNLAHFVTNEPLEGVVDKRHGY